MSYSQQQAKLGLNIAPIEVPDGSIQAGVVPYDTGAGHTELAQLRQKHRGSHAVTRQGDRIVCLPRIQGAPTVGATPEEFPLRKNLNLVAALLRESLIDHFAALQRPVISHRPVTVLGVNDLLKESLPQGISGPAWLALAPRYELDVRVFYFSKEEPFLGLALDSRTRRRITLPAASSQKRESNCPASMSAG